MLLIVCPADLRPESVENEVREALGNYHGEPRPSGSWPPARVVRLAEVSTQLPDADQAPDWLIVLWDLSREAARSVKDLTVQNGLRIRVYFPVETGLCIA